jgi:hypothetical protein
MKSAGDDPLIDVNPVTRSAYALRGAGSRRLRIRTCWEALPAADRWTGLLWLLLLGIATVYLIVFVVQIPRNVTELAWSSDYASGFVIPESIVHTGTGGNTVLASAGQWVPLWFGLLTARLPLHRELWAIAPTLLFIGTALTVGWSVAQVADRRAAILAVLLSLIASPLALAFLMAPEAHNTVYLGTALLGAYVIWLARSEGRGLLASLGVPPLVGVALGTCLASDLLVGAAAVIPLALTGTLALLRRERRSRWLGVSALTSVAVAVPVARVTTTLMHSFGYRTIETPARLAPSSELAIRARLLFKGLKVLFNGYLTANGPGPLHTPLGIASEIVMVAALLTLIALGGRATLELALSGLRQDVTRTPAQLARSLHVVYWTVSALAVSGAFWLAAETGGGTNLHESYYGTVIFSVAAVIPLVLATTPVARAMILAGSSIFFAASLVGLGGNYLNVAGAIAREAPGVTRIAQANHVSYGYGGYWQAASLTWNTHGRVTVRPLFECPNPEGPGICPFYEARVPSWYVPQRRRTFLLVDRQEAWVSSLPSGLGRPLAAYALGPVDMYIYSYDIASRLGPAPN